MEPGKEGLLWNSRLVHHSCAYTSTASSVVRGKRGVMGGIFYTAHFLAKSQKVCFSS